MLKLNAISQAKGIDVPKINIRVASIWLQWTVAIIIDDN